MDGPTTYVTRAIMTKNFLKQARKYSEPFRITDGAKFRLKKIDPGETLGFQAEEKPRAEEE